MQGDTLLALEGPDDLNRRLKEWEEALQKRGVNKWHLEDEDGRPLGGTSEPPRWLWRSESHRLKTREQITEVRGRLTMRQIVHAYLPKAKRSKAEKPAAAKPAVIVTAKSVKQVDKDKRIARGY